MCLLFVLNILMLRVRKSFGVYTVHIARVYSVRKEVYSASMTRERIFIAASQLLAAEGVSALSIRKIAKGAGLSPMAVYRHFADKDALVNALMEHGFSAWEERVTRIGCIDPVQWLEVFIGEFLDFSLDEPHLFDAAFFLPASKARQFPDDFAAQRSPTISLAIAKIEQAKAQGKLYGGTPLSIALTLWALGQGLISLHRAQRFSHESQFKHLYSQTTREYLESLKIKRDGESL
jgi:AcrR family transcriptional regulator